MFNSTLTLFAISSRTQSFTISSQYQPFHLVIFSKITPIQELFLKRFGKETCQDLTPRIFTKGYINYYLQFYIILVQYRVEFINYIFLCAIFEVYVMQYYPKPLNFSNL
jgi:hypothetical protein